MSKLSFSAAWDETRAILARDGRLIWPLGLMTLVLPQLLIGTVMGPAAMAAAATNASATSLTLLVALVLIAWTRFGGLVGIAQLALHSDERVGDALRSGLLRGPAVLGATVLLLIPLTALMAPALIATSAQQQPSPAAALAFLAGLVIGVVILARLQFAVSIAAAEGGNPIRLLVRSWQLTKGRTLRLLGFVLLFLALLLIVTLALSAVLGSLVILALGKPEPMSVAALLLSGLGLLGELLVLVPYSVMLARLYRQASHGSATVPHAP
ncbi:MULTISPECIES: hypothetical protein [Sphingomonas]|uniref:hypothetical protein n=1 Tax=Sphingomonas TaxID=13687 RepID=UPI000DEFEA17|nr:MULTISPECIES: hypothetical protein [Sphingomonas]